MNHDKDCLSLDVLSGTGLAVASEVFLTGEHSDEAA